MNDVNAVIVTGASGFLGSAVCRHLNKLKYKVVGLSRSKSAGFYPWDLQTIEKRLNELNASTVSVVHTAWYTGPGYWTSTQNALSLKYTQDLMGWMKALQVNYFVGFGTCAEYSWANGTSPFLEDATPKKPASFYGKTKIEALATIKTSLNKSNVPFSWLRLFFPYGPGQESTKLIPSLVHAARNKQAITVQTPNYVRDFIHEDDVAEAVGRLLVQKCAGEFNLGTGVGVPIGSMARAFAKKHICETVWSFNDQHALVEPLEIVAEMSKMQKILSWKPSIKLEDGMERMVLAN